MWLLPTGLTSQKGTQGFLVRSLISSTRAIYTLDLLFPQPFLSLSVFSPLFLVHVMSLPVLPSSLSFTPSSSPVKRASSEPCSPPALPQHHYHNRNQTQQPVVVVHHTELKLDSKEHNYSGECFRCKTEFGFMGRGRHHCRLCGHSFCTSCSSMVAKTSLLHREQYRCCEACHEAHTRRLRELLQVCFHFTQHKTQ